MSDNGVRVDDAPAGERGAAASRGRSRSRTPPRSRSRSPPPRRRSRSRTPPRRRPRSRSRSPRGDDRDRRAMPRRNRFNDGRDNPDAGPVLGVFGLSLYTDEPALRELFEKFGKVEKITIVYDRQTGRSRGFAFVTFEDVRDATDARNETTGMDLNGRRIRVDYSTTKRAHSPTPGQYMGDRSQDYRRRSPPRRSYRSRSRSPRRYRSRSPRRYRSRSRSPRRYRSRSRSPRRARSRSRSPPRDRSRSPRRDRSRSPR